MSNHPNFTDKLKLRFNPRYLYPGQLCQSQATVNAGIIHKLPDIKPFWKTMDYLYLKTGSVFKYHDVAKNLDMTGDFPPNAPILEVVAARVDDQKSAGKQSNPGDLICLTPFDRQFITPQPLPSSLPKTKTTYPENAGSV